MSADCLFCRIVARELPADVVHESEATLAFRDINPQAPTHVIVVSKRHEPDAHALAEADPALAGELLRAAGQVAVQQGLVDPGYRLVFNTGAGAGQSVLHVHCHVLGGRAMLWPPG